MEKNKYSPWSTKEEMTEGRRKICDGCEFYVKNVSMCGYCGCSVLNNSKFYYRKCPLGKWENHVQEE